VVTTFTPDSTAPVLEEFKVDLTEGLVYLSFTETMQGGDVVLSSMSISSDTTNTATSVTLAGTFVDVDALTVQFHLDTATLNALKKAENLATAKSNAYIKLAVGSVKDMAGVDIVETIRNADVFKEDATNPKVVSFIVDQTTNSETLEIVFDETMDRSSLAVAQISLQNQAAFSTAAEFKTLSLSIATSTSADGTTISINLKKAEVDELKRMNICVQTAACFLTITTSAITDMNTNPITPIENTAGKLANNVVGETTKPELASFVKFDYNKAEITLSFTEPVLDSPIDFTQLKLHSRANVNGGDANREFVLTGGTTDSERGATIVVSVTDDDMNSIKFLTLLCKESDGVDCYVRLGSGFIKDAFANALVPIDNTDTVMTPTTFVADTSGPILTRFTLDMQQSYLDLTFDEPVEAFTFIEPELTISNADNSVSVTLKPNLKDIENFEKSSLTGRLLLAPESVLALKAADLASSAADTYVSLTNGFVKDIFGAALPTPLNNDNQPLGAGETIPALKAGDFDADTSAPQLLSVETFDTNAGQFQLYFDEPVDIANINFDAILVQSEGAFVNGVLIHSLSTNFDAGTEEVAYSGVIESKQYITITMARCAFFDRNLHSRMPLVPTPARLKRAGV
jgi:hypothetical protein